MTSFFSNLMRILKVKDSSDKAPKKPSIVKHNKDPAEIWENISELGDGAFGKVYKARHLLESDRLSAAKQVEAESKEDLEDSMVEIEILTECQHSNIIKLHEVYLFNNKLWMYLEFCGGGALDSIMVNLEKPLTEDQIKFVCREMCQGLAFLHSKFVIHRDLKAGNVLLTTDGAVKLADFGVSAKNTNERQKRDSFIGTPYWMAPEIIMCETFKDNPYDYMADVWSLGITLIEFAQMNPPNYEMSAMRVLIKLQKAEPPHLDRPHIWSPEFNAFVKRCLIKVPQARASIEQLLLDPFLKNVSEKEQRAVHRLLCEVGAEVVETVEDLDPSTIRASMIPADFAEQLGDDDSSDTESLQESPTSSTTESKEDSMKVVPAPCPEVPKEVIKVEVKEGDDGEWKEVPHPALEPVQTNGDSSPSMLKSTIPDNVPIQDNNALKHLKEYLDASAAIKNGEDIKVNDSADISVALESDLTLVTNHNGTDVNNADLKNISLSEFGESCTDDVTEPAKFDTSAADGLPKSIGAEVVSSKDATVPSVAKSSDDSTKPSDDSTKPSDDSTKSSDDSTKPSDGVPVSSEGVGASIPRRTSYLRAAGDYIDDGEDYAELPEQKKEEEKEKEKNIPEKKETDVEKLRTLTPIKENAAEPDPNVPINKTRERRKSCYKTIKKTRIFVVDGQEVVTSSVRVVKDGNENPTSVYTLLDRRNDVRQIKALAKEENRQNRELQERHKIQLDNFKQKCNAEEMALQHNYELELDAVEKEYKVILEKADSHREMEIKHALKKLKSENNKEEQKLHDDHQTALHKLKNDLKTLPKEARKADIKKGREALEHNFNERLQAMKTEHNAAVTSLHQSMIHKFQIKRRQLEMELLVKRHTIKRNDEALRSAMEERHSQQLHQMSRAQLKELFNLKRQQTSKRLQSECDQLNEELSRETTSLLNAHIQEKKARPKYIRQLYKQRMEIKKESLRIRSNSNEEEQRSELKEFEILEQEKMTADLVNLEDRLKKQVVEMNAGHEARKRELNLLQAEKKRVLTDQETMRESHLEEAYKLKSVQMKKISIVRSEALNEAQKKELEDKENASYTVQTAVCGGSMFHINLSHSSSRRTASTSSHKHAETPTSIHKPTGTPSPANQPIGTPNPANQPSGKPTPANQPSGTPTPANQLIGTPTPSNQPSETETPTNQTTVTSTPANQPSEISIPANQPSVTPNSANQLPGTLTPANQPSGISTTADQPSDAPKSPVVASSTSEPADSPAPTDN